MHFNDLLFSSIAFAAQTLAVLNHILSGLYSLGSVAEFLDLASDKYVYDKLSEGLDEGIKKLKDYAFVLEETKKFPQDDEVLFFCINKT